MAQMVFYRYTDDYEANLIRQSRQIAPAPGQRTKWYTTDLYLSGADAKEYLSMRFTPTHRIGPIPADELPDLDSPSLRVVARKFGNHDGGLEAATSESVYLFNITSI